MYLYIFIYEYRAGEKDMEESTHTNHVTVAPSLEEAPKPRKQRGKTGDTVSSRGKKMGKGGKRKKEKGTCSAGQTKEKRDGERCEDDATQLGSVEVGVGGVCGARG